jgi:hypothetical protein
MNRRVAVTLASVALVCLPAATALAGPTVGVTLGKAQTEGDANDGADANSTLGLFVRGRVSRVVQLQAEVGKLQTDEGPGGTIRTGTVAAIFELGHARTGFVPFVLAGVGLDYISDDCGCDFVDDSKKYVHGEGGVGLEYRFAGGLIVGADARIGTRSQFGQPTYYAATGGGIAVPEVARFVASTSLSEGQYRSARLTLGVHF